MTEVTLEEVTHPEGDFESNHSQGAVDAAGGDRGALKVMRERSADEKLLALVFKVLYCCFTAASLLLH